MVAQAGMSGMQPTLPHTVERCQLLLERWHSQLQPSPRERGLLGGELHVESSAATAAATKMRVALFGRVELANPA